MRLKVLAVAVMLGVCGLAAKAQMGGSMGGMDMSSSKSGVESPAKALDALLSLYEGEAMGVVKTMPADKYSFAPSAATFAPGSGAKFSGVRTFAAQVTHVAQANYAFYSAVGGMKPDVDMGKIAGMTSKEDCVEILAKSFAFAHKAIATITAENAFLTIKPIDGMNTRASVAAFGVAHGYDHYGQMVEYLRMNGLVPPGSK